MEGEKLLREHKSILLGLCGLRMGGVSRALREELGGGAEGGAGRSWASVGRRYYIEYFGINIAISIPSRTLFGLTTENDNN